MTIPGVDQARPTSVTYSRQRMSTPVPSPVDHGWNIADVWEVVADTLPAAPAQYHLDQLWSWSDFDNCADGIATTLLAAGAQQQDKVALYLYNGPEYLQCVFGLFKAGLVPTNTNYRYTDDELVFIWDNADAVAVIFHGSFTNRCAAIRHRLPKVTTWIWADDGTSPQPAWATSFSRATACATGRTSAPWGRSGDDMLFVYTGGTTGMPKGVMWRQDDLLCVLDATNKNPLPEGVDPDAVRRRAIKAGPRNIPAAPLMHGTGLFNAMTNLMIAGSIVTMAGHHFDPVELLDTIERHRANSMSIVGDAFAKPILRALDAQPDRWDISSLRVIVSSGVIWSAETKAGLLRHNERLILADTLGSSEAIGMATNVTSAGTAGKTAAFRLGNDTLVLTEDGHPVVPGSGERGRVALRGRSSVGYYKDAAKSASTFVFYDGVRYSIPGDWAEIDADGTVTLLGRGSQCINTGGEKVFPEEVEETLKLYPGVADAAVVGLPDERFGEAITALVQISPTEPTLATVTEADLIAYVRTRLAAYKSPKRILFIDNVERAANGKLDYKQLKARAITAIAEVPSTP
jgi:3-oxocholest-4-en-26-oate---CoA ligase